MKPDAALSSLTFYYYTVMLSRMEIRIHKQMVNGQNDIHVWKNKEANLCLCREKNTADHTESIQ